jgi:hypothetical protein
MNDSKWIGAANNLLVGCVVQSDGLQQSFRIVRSFFWQVYLSEMPPPIPKVEKIFHLLAFYDSY